MIYIDAKTLGFRRIDFSSIFATTHARILTSLSSIMPYGFDFSQQGTLSYHSLMLSVASVLSLAPLNFRRETPIGQ